MVSIKSFPSNTCDVLIPTNWDSFSVAINGHHGRWMIYWTILNLVMVLLETGQYFPVAFSVPLRFVSSSPGFTKFLNVMLELDGIERKSVVQFITGCSSLPPGGSYTLYSRRLHLFDWRCTFVFVGLANLRPRLAVARKVEADDNSYPSVNTCYHYLKLPDYSSEETLKVRLMTACKERGFYFNWTNSQRVMISLS